MSVPSNVLESLAIFRKVEPALAAVGFKLLGVSRSRDRDGKFLSMELRVEPMESPNAE